MGATQVPPVYHLIIHETGHLPIGNYIEKWAPPPPANGVRRVAFLMLAYGARKREPAPASPGGPKPCLLCKLKAHRGFPRGRETGPGGSSVWRGIRCLVGYPPVPKRRSAEPGA